MGTGRRESTSRSGTATSPLSLLGPEVALHAEQSEDHGVVERVFGGLAMALGVEDQSLHEGHPLGGDREVGLGRGGVPATTFPSSPAAWSLTMFSQVAPTPRLKY
jgi:hypothetical protein